MDQGGEFVSTEATREPSSFGNLAQVAEFVGAEGDNGVDLIGMKEKK